MTDRELLARYLEGDIALFETILSRHETSLLRFVASLRGADRESARDIVQDVFLRLVATAPKLREVENLSAWLYRVARNLSIDHARKEVRMERRYRMVAGPEPEAPPRCEEEQREVAGIVSQKLLGLPPNQRDVLILKIQEGRTYREISEITGLTVSNVGYLVHHGLKALSRELRIAGVV